ncbi:hypothetical protein [Rhodocyclus tenuis]|uniref:Uncharacterized protein n=1 Tax=Rhodocyclus tenuis TaxID=1066 RepID=A0A840G620_RHOTE|nr:hypothetical protein [Rhodocyclus tenuis]MBB4247346.1 hypothetical protein [Rhodocyclus tenuis]
MFMIVRSICNAGGVLFAPAAWALIGIRCFLNSNVIFRARPLQKISSLTGEMTKYFDRTMAGSGRKRLTRGWRICQQGGWNGGPAAATLTPPAPP